MSNGIFPEGSIRAFDATRDIAAVAALLNRNAQAFGASSMTDDELRRYLDLSERDPARDRWIALATDGTCVGFAGIYMPPETPCVELTLAVATNGQCRSMRQPLLERALNRARELGAESALTYLPPADESTAGFLRDHGFQIVDGYRSFVWEASAPVRPPSLPQGFRLRPYSQVQRPADLIEADNRCYLGLWGHKAATETSTRQLLEALPSDGILLLYDDDNAIVGCIKATEIHSPRTASDDPTGYLDGPGIVPRLRGGRRHADLALAGLHWLSERGHQHVLMETWGESAEAVRHYEAIGFRHTAEELAFAVRWTDTGTP